MILADILKDSNYKLTQFEDAQIQTLETACYKKEGKAGYYTKCLVRNKEIKLTPEEAVRQLYILMLRDDYGYPTDRMQVEYPVNFGREVKRADIVIFDKQMTTAVYILVELKKPKLKDGKEQLRSYCNATGTEGGNIESIFGIKSALLFKKFMLRLCLQISSFNRSPLFAPFQC